MCNEAEHKTHKLLEDLKTIIDGRPPLGRIYQISSTQPYELDYQERKHVFVYPLSTFTITLEEYGTNVLTANTWTEIIYPPGLRIYAQGQTSLVGLFVLCTDELINNTGPVSTTFAAGASIAINDGVSNSIKATVAQFHNQDNQNIGSGNGLLTGGVAQILNPGGLLDRQRGTGLDAVPAVGIPSGSQQLAGSALTTTFNGPVTGNANSQTITVASTANMKIGDMVTTSDNVESTEVLTVPSGTTFTAILKNNHANSQTLTWYHFNQARDASVGDNVAGTGLSPSATYLYNNVTGNFEFDRSANGEKDGASGQGTAVAAEYEYNANPLANGSVLSGLQFDRARNVQAGGLGSGTISNNPLAANSTTLTLNSAPTTLDKGAQIVLDRAGTNPETNYVATSYTPGSTSVPLQIATQFSHAQNATVEWSQHAPLGPQLNGFLPSGLGMEEEIVYDPVSKKYYVEIAATADGNSGQNIVLENVALYNGTTFDRLKGTNGAANVAAQAQTSGGSTPFHALSAASNNATSVKGSAGQLYGLTISNTNAAARFFKLYNKASAPAPATDNALIVLTIQVPANATVVHAFPEGMVFSTGIAFAAVVNISDTDNTSIGANDLSMDLRYK